jgi:hypothetical protein
MGDPLSPKAVEATKKRDGELIGLSRNPGEALRQWKRLKPQEQSAVVLYMQQVYDKAFAEQFKETANKPGRPDLTVQITNTPDVTPDGLRAKGFRLKSSGSPEIWVNPSGTEIWRMQPPKAGPTDGSAAPDPVRPTGLPPVRPHPDTEAIRLDIADMAAWQDQVKRKATALVGKRGRVPTDQFLREEEDFYKDNDDYREELKKRIKEHTPDSGPMSPEEQEGKKKALDDLKKLEDFTYAKF